MLAYLALSQVHKTIEQPTFWYPYKELYHRFISEVKIGLHASILKCTLKDLSYWSIKACLDSQYCIMTNT